MPSVVDSAKRALVTFLRMLAQKHDVQFPLTRDAPDAEVTKAFRTLARKAHPDRGGTHEDMLELNRLRDTWQDAKQARGRRGQPRKRPAGAPARSQQHHVSPVPILPFDRQEVPQARNAYRINSEAVMLTYMGISDKAQWGRFLHFVASRLRLWHVKHYSATLEQCADGKFHIHVMLQFTKVVDRTTRPFMFEGVRPNACVADLLGGSLAKKKMQTSIDRGMFYVWANKIGTVLGDDGIPLVAGNYAPCWTESKFRYKARSMYNTKIIGNSAVCVRSSDVVTCTRVSRCTPQYYVSK
jgi:hypothetical protein